MPSRTGNRVKCISLTMVNVNVLEIEVTSMGEMAEVEIDKHVEPSVGMILMDEESQTWEITATLHGAKRLTHESHTRRWTFQCKPVNTQTDLHPGTYKLIH